MTATLPGTEKKGGNQQRNRNVNNSACARTNLSILEQISVFLTLLAGKEFKI